MESISELTSCYIYTIFKWINHILKKKSQQFINIIIFNLKSFSEFNK